MNCLKVGGTYVLIGGVGQPYSVPSMQMLFGHQKLEGSLVGGIPETQKMLDFCAKHGIKPSYRVIAAKDASEHFKALAEGSTDAERCVIDLSTITDM